jgi:ABC-2 type transport system ATP-binding protein
MAGIQVKHIIKSYNDNGIDILKDVSFEIPSGKKIGILGPNGAGKTSLISILCGILEPNTGDIIYFDKEKSITSKEFKALLGYVPQELALYETLNPMQNIAYFGAMYGMNKIKIQLKAEEVLKLLGLWTVRYQKVSTFSGGMKRRLNLAIALLHEPKILFLDEPTVGIDVQSKNAIITLLNDFNKNGTTIIYTSHHLNEAELLCDDVLLLDQGKIIDYDSIQNLKQKTKLNHLEDIFLSLTGTAYRD